MHLPELPEAKAIRFVKDFGIPEYDAQVLTAEKPLADYFETCVKHHNSPKKISNWIMTELMRELKNSDSDIQQIKIKPEALARLVALIDSGDISGAIAKTIFAEMWSSGADPEKIVEAKGLKQVSDSGAIEALIDKILASEPENVQLYKAGKMNVLGHFVGQVMKQSQGKANPKIVNEILKKKLG